LPSFLSLLEWLKQPEASFRQLLGRQLLKQPPIEQPPIKKRTSARDFCADSAKEKK